MLRLPVEFETALASTGQDALFRSDSIGSRPRDEWVWHEPPDFRSLTAPRSPSLDSYLLCEVLDPANI